MLRSDVTLVKQLARIAVEKRADMTVDATRPWLEQVLQSINNVPGQLNKLVENDSGSSLWDRFNNLPARYKWAIISSILGGGITGATSAATGGNVLRDLLLGLLLGGLAGGGVGLAQDYLRGDIDHTDTWSPEKLKDYRATSDDPGIVRRTLTDPDALIGAGVGVAGAATAARVSEGLRNRVAAKQMKVPAVPAAALKWRPQARKLSVLAAAQEQAKAEQLFEDVVNATAKRETFKLYNPDLTNTKPSWYSNARAKYNRLMGYATGGQHTGINAKVNAAVAKDPLIAQLAKRVGAQAGISPGRIAKGVNTPRVAAALANASRRYGLVDVLRSAAREAGKKPNLLKGRIKPLAIGAALAAAYLGYKKLFNED